MFSLRCWIVYAGMLLSMALSSSAFEIAPSAASQAWLWYKGALSTHPLMTKSLTSSGIMTFSDAICQKLTMSSQREEAERPRLDFSRILQVAITGFTWSGPITHLWYGTLENIVTIEDPMLGLIARIFLDAIIFSPITITGYFTWRSILEGSGVPGACEKLRILFAPTVVGAWKFWPLANIVNFGFVPVELRVLYSNVLSLFWTGYLSYVNANKVTAKKD